MAIAKKLVQPVKKLLPSKIALPAKNTSIRKELVLPTECNEIPIPLEEHHWLIYGQKKVGKSSFAVQFEHTLHMAFESAAKTVKSVRVDCTDWSDFVEYISLLEKGKHSFKNVIIDTGLEAYNRCMEWVCKQNNIEHPSGQNDFGLSWGKVSAEFRKQHERIKNLGLGLIIVCHEKLKESETIGGQKFEQIVPALSSQADEYYRGAIDNVIYMHKRGGERFMVVRGSDFCVAGIGFDPDEHFGTSEGEPISAVPMGTSAKIGYKNFIEAYENMQCETFTDETKRFEDESIAKSIRENLRKKEKQQKKLNR